MKKTTVYLVITIVFFLTIVIAAAYATITSIIRVENKANIYAWVGNKLTFTVNQSATLNTFIDFESMQSSGSNVIAGSANANINVVLTSDDYRSGCCTYDIIWEWNSTSVTKNRYTKTTGATNEYVLVGYQNDTAYYYTGEVSPDLMTTMSPQITFTAQLPNYNASSLSTVVYSGQICNKHSLNTKVAYKVNQYWNLETRFYNLTLNQDAFQGASFVGKARIGNVSCSAGDYYNYPTTKVYWNLASSQQPGRIPETVYSTAEAVMSASGRSFYIASEYFKHYACVMIDGHELCLNQPYTQYGLSGHTSGNSFTTAQQTSARQAIYQAFIDAGINIDIDEDCSPHYGYSYYEANNILCHAGGVSCGINFSGDLVCADLAEDAFCLVENNGTAFCGFAYF